MPTAKGFVPTDRADRYLHQLSTHLSHGPGGIRAEPRLDGTLLIDLGNATCTLTTTPTGLILNAESPTRDALHTLQRKLTTRIQQIGHRDTLSVAWDPAPPPSDTDDAHHLHLHRKA